MLQYSTTHAFIHMTGLGKLFMYNGYSIDTSLKYVVTYASVEDCHGTLVYNEMHGIDILM